LADEGATVELTYNGEGGPEPRIRGAFAGAFAAAVVMVCFGSCAGGAYGASSESRICSEYRCKTLVAGTRVRVLKATARHKQQTPSSITFAQWVLTGRLEPISNSEALERVTSHFVIAGRYLAFASVSVDPDEEYGFPETTILLNAKTGRERRMPGTFFEAPSRGVVQVVVTAAGSLAWMIEGLFHDPIGEPAAGYPAGRAIYGLRAGAKEPALLAYSENIVPMSLAATSGRIYWLETSGPRTYAAP